MKTAKDVLKSIKDNDVKYVDLRFTDPRGKWQHVTFDIGMIDEEIFAEGTMFDGSSIAGWKAINESDMCLMPDPVTATIDPFFAETTMILTRPGWLTAICARRRASRRGSTKTTCAGSRNARSVPCRWWCGAVTGPNRRPPSSSTCTPSSRS